MKVLVIPDVHLKPNMFAQASQLMEQGVAEQAVCLMDIPDDWDKQFNLEAYEQAYDAAIAFAKAFPDTRWCYGNHDLCYLLDERETGFSIFAAPTVCRKLGELSSVLPEDNPIRYVQMIDNVLFSHGGISEHFVQRYLSSAAYKDPVRAVTEINELDPRFMWLDDSPLWFRPQYSSGKRYKPRKCLQVVGHTPTEAITRDKNVISCDVFSTYSNGNPIGTQEFLVIDTITWDYEGVK